MLGLAKRLKIKILQASTDAGVYGQWRPLGVVDRYSLKERLRLPPSRASTRTRKPRDNIGRARASWLRTGPAGDRVGGFNMSPRFSLGFSMKQAWTRGELYERGHLG
jgi:hypothetical protein